MLFVTGMLRCGTTLLEKLLANHPEISLLSQPFPFVFLDAKRAFLAELGREQEAYPLGDLFLERGYSPEDFSRFLARYRIERAQLLDTFRAMADYSGQCTRFAEADVEAAVDRLKPAAFAGTVAQLYKELGQPKPARWHGAKETLCEEFLPHFLEQGAVCALIIRDPRDMLASLNHGRGQSFGGALKPTLFNLRHWRKSVAFALHLRLHPHFVAMRYEDLVADPVPLLNQLAKILGVSPFDAGMFAEGIRDQDGTLWQGNSSHFAARGLDGSSIGSYRTALPEEVVAFTEAACYPELRYLGYDIALARTGIRDAILGFKDPYDNIRENLRDLFADPARLAEEAGRADYLFDDVRAMLRNAAET